MNLDPEQEDLKTKQELAIGALVHIKRLIPYMQEHKVDKQI
jgi:hypothetical protein